MSESTSTTENDIDRGVYRVDPALIRRQREAGWPDMHPEEFCHRCGQRNPDWCASAEDWKVATAAWSEATGREGICCPECFTELHEAATGQVRPWVYMPWRGSWSAHAEVRALPDRETAAAAIDQVAGWQALRKYSVMPSEWMDQVRDAIARVVLEGVQGDEKSAGNSAWPDRETIARAIVERFGPDYEDIGEIERDMAGQQADAVLALFGQEVAR